MIHMRIRRISDLRLFRLWQKIAQIASNSLKQFREKHISLIKLKVVPNHIIEAYITFQWIILEIIKENVNICKNYLTYQKIQASKEENSVSD